MFSLALLISAMVTHPINQNASCLLPCQRQNIHNIQQILDVYILRQADSDHALCTTRGSFCSSRKRNWAVWTQSHITLQRWEQADIWGEVPCEDKELDRDLCFPYILDRQHFCTLVDGSAWFWTMGETGFTAWGQQSHARALQWPQTGKHGKWGQLQGQLAKQAWLKDTGNIFNCLWKKKEVKKGIRYIQNTKKLLCIRVSVSISMPWLSQPVQILNQTQTVQAKPHKVSSLHYHTC